MMLSLAARVCTPTALATASARALSAQGKVPLALVKQLRADTNAPIVDCKNALADPEVAGDLALAKDWLRKRGMSAASARSDRATSQGLVGLVRSDAAAALIEINSETDFVARNDSFQTLVRDAAAAVLELPAGSGDVELDAVLAAKAGEAQTPVGDAVHDLVAAVRESVSVRRAARQEGAVLGAYVHNKVSDGLGQAAAIVVLGGDVQAGDEAAAAFAHKAAMHVVAARPRYLSKETVPEGDVAKERAIIAETIAEQNPDKPENVVTKMVEGRMGKFHQETVLLEQPHMVVGGKDSVAKVMAKELGKGAELVGFSYFRVGES